jgi:hypothetical protein
LRLRVPQAIVGKDTLQNPDLLAPSMSLCLLDSEVAIFREMAEDSFLCFGEEGREGRDVVLAGWSGARRRYTGRFSLSLIHKDIAPYCHESEPTVQQCNTLLTDSRRLAII